jgi:hypothetical protein
VASTQGKTLRAEDVPAWLSIEFLDGTCPVQGWGRVGAWNWYFHARWGSWSITASVGVTNPIDLSAYEPPCSDTAFFYEEDYGDRRYDAGYMDLGEARHFIVRELTRLRSERGDLGGKSGEPATS